MAVVGNADYQTDRPGVGENSLTAFERLPSVALSENTCLSCIWDGDRVLRHGAA